MRGRAPFICTPLSAFIKGVDNATAPIIPYNHEIAIDTDAYTNEVIPGKPSKITTKGDGAIGYIEVYKDANGIDDWRFKSVEQVNSNLIDTMDMNGLFDNAGSAVVSRDLTYFTFDVKKGTIILNKNLVYPSTYTHYAIRSGINYITGYVDNVGKLVTNLVKIETKPVAQGVGWVGIPGVGMLLPNAKIVDGDSYIVEFFDEKQSLICRDVFWAESVTILTNDISGSSSIVDLEVSTTRVMVGEPGSTFLYRGESTKQIGFNIFLVYANGDRRDVTYEKDGGKITIKGLNEIDTSKSTSTPSVFTVTYNCLDENSTSVTSSYTKSVNVYIIDNVIIDNSVFIPLYWIPSNVSSKFNHRLFMVQGDGRLSDVTQCETMTTVVDPGSVNINQPVTSTLMFDTIPSPQHYNYSIKVLPDDNQVRRVEVSNGTKQFSNDYMGIVYKRSDKTASFIGGTSAAILNAMLQNNKSIPLDGINAITPTKFSIRSMDGSWYYTPPTGVVLDLQGIVNFSFNEGLNNGRTYTPSEPVIIEFLYDEVEIGTTKTIQKVTNIRAAYIKV